VDRFGSVVNLLARVPENRRLEALRRLTAGLTHDDGLDDLLDLLRELLGADLAALTLVGGSRARTVAAAGAPVDEDGVSREQSVADRAVRAPGGVVRFDDVDREDALGHHPWCRRTEPAVTLAAVAVRAPDGSPIGAFELGWCETASVPATWEGLATRAAGQLGRWLERRAEAVEYRHFVELAPDAVAVVDLAGTIELANPAMGRLLGTEPADLLGRSLFGLTSPEDAARGSVAFAQVLAARETTTTFDATLCRPDGVRVPASISAGHLRGSRPTLQVVVRDLTERVRTENERSALTEQLAKAHRFEIVGQLAGGLAHDLNNLLTILLANVSMANETVTRLEAGGSLETAVAALREDLDMLGQAAGRVGGLTRELLQFASREAGEPEPVDVAATVTGLVSLLDRSVGTAVRLDVAVDERIGPVELDRGGFERAVTNLVLNARDAVEETGTVLIDVRTEFAGDGSARTGDAFPELVVEVADDGCGMSDAVLARAFEPLYSTKPADAGSGLGLATVQAFVEGAGGSLHVDSVEGEGTSVTMRLPATGPPPAPEVVGGAQVVLVEPADRTRRVVAAMLRSAGYGVHAVANGEDGLAALAEEAAQVLICDLQLPGERAVEVAGRARARCDGLGVVFLSGSPEPTSVAAGAAVLTKPFASERLLEAVASAGGMAAR
jgi:two-component system, cell cycle sensor histidine kinase and response regulator CckA